MNVIISISMNKKQNKRGCIYIKNIINYQLLLLLLKNFLYWFFYYILKDLILPFHYYLFYGFEGWREYLHCYFFYITKRISSGYFQIFQHSICYSSYISTFLHYFIIIIILFTSLKYLKLKVLLFLHKHTYSIQNDSFLSLLKFKILLFFYFYNYRYNPSPPSLIYIIIYNTIT